MYSISFFRSKRRRLRPGFDVSRASELYRVDIQRLKTRNRTAFCRRTSVNNFFFFSLLLHCLFNLESKYGPGLTNNLWLTRLKEALLDREDCNVVLVDWSRGARFPYMQASGNSRLVGAQTAELIRFLISSTSGSPDLADRFYIVGFSLGAQIAGYAGTNLLARGMVLGRITGIFCYRFISFV